LHKVFLGSSIRRSGRSRSGNNFNIIIFRISIGPSSYGLDIISPLLNRSIIVAILVLVIRFGGFSRGIPTIPVVDGVDAAPGVAILRLELDLGGITIVNHIEAGHIICVFHWISPADAHSYGFVVVRLCINEVESVYTFQLKISD
jgi:hypothetical protein